MSVQNVLGRSPVRLAMAIFWVMLVAWPSGCMRMKALGSGKPEVTLPLSEPRPVENLVVPLQKDPTKIYRVGPRDTLRISVRKDPTLTQVYPVTEEGNILLPNIDPVKVEGLTTVEIEKKLNDLLSEYIRSPEVKVGVQDYLSKRVYVIGQVVNPGPQIMRADMLTLQEAIFAAGLPTDAAALHRALVISPSEKRPVVRQIDLTEILYQGKMSENILLQPSDTVYIPARYAVTLGAVLNELFSPLERIYDYKIRADSAKSSKNNNNSSQSNNSNNPITIISGQ